ncbi:hypothetical protein FACS189485_09620 [Spirochaetia bacterium]|nr:hypothetical protein FACS189485_09620 [Spirochaetia bacterium]
MTERYKCNDLTGKEWLQNSFSIWRSLTKTKEEKELNHPASFPVSLCEKIIRTFSQTESIVLDPFNGAGATMIASENLGHKGIGIELSAEFCDIARSRLHTKKKIKIIQGDNNIELDKLEENSCGLCFTSPPYWDILNMKRSADKKQNINYSSSDNDIGNMKNYDEFITALKTVFIKVKRVLAINSYCIINVMDIRKGNKFYSLHSDLITAMQEIGFVYDDIIIWDRQSDYNNMRPLGYPSKFRINKVHEYILIFIKEK